MNFPLTFLESQTRFRVAAVRAGAELKSYPILARGQAGETLSIDTAYLGTRTPQRAIVVMSGVHGIEGFAGSAIQTELLSRSINLSPRDGVLFIHGVNPWGMSWWRRANENNVDLNRNWQDFDQVLPPNEPYVQVHDLLCPSGPELPDPTDFLIPIGTYIESKGIGWVRSAIAAGQYTHPHGLYYGGFKREPSTIQLAQAATDYVSGATDLLILDMHTGFGPYATHTIISPTVSDTRESTWLTNAFGAENVRPVPTNLQSGIKPKRGRLAHGLIKMLAPQNGIAAAVEIGTRNETRLLLAERAEHWVHQHGIRTNPEHWAAIWEHRVCWTPDDLDWEDFTLDHGDRVFDEALAAMFS